MHSRILTVPREWNSEWIGLENFRTAFDSPFFQTALRNTLILNGLKLLIGFPAAIVLALLLIEVRVTWFKRSVQTATILPYFISWVVAATMFRNLLAPEGVVNEILQTYLACSRSFSCPTRPSFAG